MFEHVNLEQAAAVEQEQKTVACLAPGWVQGSDLGRRDRSNGPLGVQRRSGGGHVDTPGRVPAVRYASEHVGHWSRALKKPSPEETPSRGQD